MNQEKERLSFRSVPHYPSAYWVLRKYLNPNCRFSLFFGRFSLEINARKQ